VDRATLKLAAKLSARAEQRYASYLSECDADRKDGYRSHYCEHGVNLWIDYDPICGYCEDGQSAADGVLRRREAISEAKERVAKSRKIVQLIIDAERLGLRDALNTDLIYDRVAALRNP
jgi:hypothetical protein